MNLGQCLICWGLLRPQAGQQYSAGANTSAIVDVLRVVISAPRLCLSDALLPQDFCQNLLQCRQGCK